jgi:hypothetical protein
VNGSDLPSVAFYYPGPMWRASDYIKNLLLFFDGVALLVPEYMLDRSYFIDPSLVEGLQQHVLKSESLMDKQAAEALATQLGELLASGALDHLASWEAVGVRPV